MAYSPAQCLLRLPICLRHETMQAKVLDLSRITIGLRTSPQRTFQRDISSSQSVFQRNTSRTGPQLRTPLRKPTQATPASSPQPKQQQPAPKPTVQAQFSRTSTPASSPLRTSPPPSPRQPSPGSSSTPSLRSRAPPKRTPANTPRPNPADTPTGPPSPATIASYGAQLLGPNTTEALLYHAPRHGSFALSAIICGFGIAAMGWNFFSIAAPGYIHQTAQSVPLVMSVAQITVLVASMACMLMGGSLLTAPNKLVRSIRLIRDPANARRYLMRFHMRPTMCLPRLRSKTFDVDPAQVQIGPRLTVANLVTRNVPLTQGTAFTAAWSEGAAAAPKPAKGSAEAKAAVRYGRGGGPGKGMMLFQNVRRMFLRDGMAMVKVGEKEGTWKIDLWDAAMLDEMRPFSAMVTKANVDRSLFARIKAMTR